MNAANNQNPASSVGHFPLSVLCLSRSWGGLELNTVRFADWMRQRGWPVEIITLPDSPIAARAAELGLPVQVLRNPWKALDLPAASRLASMLHQFGTRGLVVTRNGDLALAVLCKTVWRPTLKLVYQQHMQLGIAKRGLLHTLRYGTLDGWLSPLPGLAKEVLEKTRLPAARLHVVPLGIELEKFAHSGRTQAQAREALGLELPPGAVVLGLIGRFDEHKGQLFVVEVFAELHRRYPNTHLLLVGEPTRNIGDAYHQALLAKISALSLDNAVHVRGFTLNPEVVYRAFDISIVASTNETYGMVTIEAMATGLPVVASATGGTLEIIAHGRTGLLAPLGDHHAFAAALEQLIQQPTSAKKLGQQAQVEALEKYSHHHQCEQTEKILWSLVAA